MKTLMLFLTLTASVWSSFSFAENVYKFENLRVERRGSTQRLITVEPTTIVTDTLNEQEALIFVQESVLITDTSTGNTCTFPDTNGWNIDCPGQAAGLFVASYRSIVEEDPSNSCKQQEGMMIDGLHNSDEPYCARVGNTGGADPQPLLCRTKGAISTDGGISFTHYVSRNTCTAVDGPIAPDDGEQEPEPPCTENCEPTDPETPPGGDDGSDIPDSSGGTNAGNSNVSGTITDSNGNVTNIDLTMEQDFTPVTERINETNKRLEAENKNSSTIIDRLNDLIHGTTDNGEKLDEIKDAIAGLETGSDMSGVEEGLTEISDGIDGLRDELGGNGSFEDGADLANNVDLPDAQDLLDAFEAVDEAINSEANTRHFNELQGAADGFTAFDSIPQLFAVAAESCSPIPFWRYEWDVCSYTPTIRQVLTYITTILLIIFLIRSVSEDLKKIRLTI